MAAKNSKSDNLPALPKYLIEDEQLSQECKDLIDTLPTESGWINNYIHQYNGFWLNTGQLQGTLNCRSYFQAQDSDILLVTSPKAGTTWLKALSFTILNRKTHYPNPQSDLTQTHHLHPLLTTNPHDLVPFLDTVLYFQTTMPDLRSFPSPRLFATHLPYILLPESVKQSRCKIVYLCRNPNDQFVSMWHFANKLRPETRGLISIEDSFDKFCQGKIGYGPFWDHILGYYKESLERPEKTMFLRFEELKSAPVNVLKDLAEFIGCGFSKDEENDNIVENILKLCGFENLSNLEVNKSGKVWCGIENKAYFRRGQVGDWKNFLTSDMIKHLNLITQEKLGKHGFNF
ncbi:cytosolic sulfotransferase 12-like [Prosopis cineraria]|uniref:cytosolic sulfotransferase 12-like n=1 Tax=Prosopis cineraria TaxID=364024 RepID=UPI0024107349|nr:cytosolic sulfotransferase 12-like [Prosopis cineraria]XP_054824827.1 cytosolic sulfotransferase 12-like [Prosopis cineraria]